MNTLYKSSRLQTYLYFIIYPLLMAVSTYFLIGIISYGDFGVFNIIIILVLLFALVESTESLFTLRYIEVTDEGILTKTPFHKETIEYRNVVHVYNLVTYKSAHLIIWYEDETTGKLKVILVIPERKFLSSETISYLSYRNHEDLAITKYIKERSSKDNPNYLNINNPRWFLFSISPTFKL